MTNDQPSLLEILARLVEVIGVASLATGLIAVNFIAFALFGIDKAKAESGAWRVKESTLLAFAAMGGSPGAYAGRALFRHKTRKQPFNDNLEGIVLLQVLAIGGLTLWWWIG